MAKEETLRARAVSMYTQGQSVSDIAKALGRSRQWVHKWINRSLSDSADWSQSLSTAPHCSPYKVSLSMEEQVIRATSAAADAFTCGLQSEIYRSRPYHRGWYGIPRLGNGRRHKATKVMYLTAAPSNPCAPWYR